jgi:hypothetical protein
MAALLAVCDGAMAGTATPDSIIVMPARKRVVQIASNLSRCKDIGLVTYNTSPLLASPLLHVWNGQEWVQISMDEYVQGTFMTGEPRHVFILGDSTLLPAVMAAPAWGQQAHRIASLDTATLVNEIGQALKLSPRQWRWLAGIHDLTLQDTNTERRRYGRWGAPGKEQDGVAPAAGKRDILDLPPAPIATENEPRKDADPKAEIKLQITPGPNATESVPIVEPPLKADDVTPTPPSVKLPETVPAAEPKADCAPACKSAEAAAPQAPAAK